jgi:glycogen debranching enzyme
VRVYDHSSQPVEIHVRLDAAADFADLFEVKDALEKRGQVYSDVRGDQLVLGYRRDEFVRETSITASEHATIDEHGLSFHITVDPKSMWQTCLDVTPHAGTAVRAKHGHGVSSPQPNMHVSLEEWIASAPELTSSWDKLGQVYRRSLVDLAALRFYTDVLPDESVPAAGPAVVHGAVRSDSLITSYQALPFTPDLADATLRVRSARQGQSSDPFRDEEPGKILHELRVGELTTFGARPHSPYYGSDRKFFALALDGDKRQVDSLTSNIGHLLWSGIVDDDKSTRRCST